jgi:hypothetical protein
LVVSCRNVERVGAEARCRLQPFQLSEPKLVGVEAREDQTMSGVHVKERSLFFLLKNLRF